MLNRGSYEVLLEQIELFVINKKWKQSKPDNIDVDQIIQSLCQLLKKTCCVICVNLSYAEDDSPKVTRWRTDQLYYSLYHFLLYITLFKNETWRNASHF